MRRHCSHRSIGPLAIVGLVLTILTAVPAAAAPATPGAARNGTTPSLTVTPVVSGLDHPWDVGFLPDGTMFFTERSGRLWVRLTTGELVLLRTMGGADDFWASGETGLMSVEVDPDFASTRHLYTCQGRASDTSVVVDMWTAAPDLRSVAFAYTVVAPIDGSTGRHGGCQLRFDDDGALRISTGDAAVGTNPQSLTTLAGKTLRVDKLTGEGVAGNPFIGSANAFSRKIFTYGHRNVQGITVQPVTGTVWSIEQGSYRDDEVNVLIAGGNYGWNPVPRVSGDPSYNEGPDSPMTDPSIPGAIPAAWSSGDPTIATSAGTFLRGAQWGPWDGALAVMALKDQHMEVMVTSGASITSTTRPPALDHTYGRLRGAELAPDGALYVTTDNGAGVDQILRVSPAGASTPPSSLPIGNLDAVVANSAASVQGWATDLDTPDQPVEIDVYANGTFAGWGYADQQRSDVGPHGFAVTAALPAPSNDVCAYAIDTTAPATNHFLGCRTVTRGGLPFGNLEALVRVPGGLSVQGWAIDPDTPAPIEVDVYVDGGFAGYDSAAGARPDLVALGRGTAHGYAVTVAATEGTHQVCAFGIDDRGPINPLLGCVTTFVSSQPLGNLDGFSVAADELILQGWAIDPDSSGAVEVDVLRGGTVAGYGWASEARADVAGAFPPWAGVGRGFSISVSISTLAGAGGSQPYCAYAINVGVGVNRLLGCATA